MRSKIAFVVGLVVVTVVSAEDKKGAPAPDQQEQIASMRIAMHSLNQALQESQAQTKAARAEAEEYKRLLQNLQNTALGRELCTERGLALEDCVVTQDGKVSKKTAQPVSPDKK